VAQSKEGDFQCCKFFKRLLSAKNNKISHSSFRPWLEGLEERLNLSPPPPVQGVTYEWVGGTDISWTDGRNWKNDSTGTTNNGYPESADTAKFDSLGSGNLNCKTDDVSNMTVSVVDIQSSWKSGNVGGDLEISTNLKTVSTSDLNNSATTTPSSITVDNGSTLEFQGNFNWNGGDLLAPSTSHNATIQVDTTSVVTAGDTTTTDEQHLGPFVQDDGSWNWSEKDKIDVQAKFTIKSDGYVKFTQTATLISATYELVGSTVSGNAATIFLDQSTNATGFDVNDTGVDVIKLTTLPVYIDGGKMYVTGNLTVTGSYTGSSGTAASISTSSNGGTFTMYCSADAGGVTVTAGSDIYIYKATMTVSTLNNLAFTGKVATGSLTIDNGTLNLPDGATLGHPSVIDSTLKIQDSFFTAKNTSTINVYCQHGSGTSIIGNSILRANSSLSISSSCTTNVSIYSAGSNYDGTYPEMLTCDTELPSWAGTVTVTSPSGRTGTWSNEANMGPFYTDMVVTGGGGAPFRIHPVLPPHNTVPPITQVPPVIHRMAADVVFATPGPKKPVVEALLPHRVPRHLVPAEIVLAG
jgi:hypothetical protein